MFFLLCRSPGFRRCAPTPVFLWCCCARHSPQHDVSAPSDGKLAVAWQGPRECCCPAVPLRARVCGRQVVRFHFRRILSFASLRAMPCVLRSLPCTSCACLVPAGMSKKSSNPVVSLTSGCIAGAVEAICVWPLEFVKASSSNFRHVFLLDVLPWHAITITLH